MNVPKLASLARRHRSCGKGSSSSGSSRCSSSEDCAFPVVLVTVSAASRRSNFRSRTPDRKVSAATAHTFHRSGLDANHVAIALFSVSSASARAAVTLLTAYSASLIISRGERISSARDRSC